MKGRELRDGQVEVDLGGRLTVEAYQLGKFEDKVVDSARNLVDWE
jgi:hypothetical protein